MDNNEQDKATSKSLELGNAARQVSCITTCPGNEFAQLFDLVKEIQLRETAGFVMAIQNSVMQTPTTRTAVNG